MYQLKSDDSQEKRPPDDPLIRGWTWSKWVLAMTPDKCNNFRRETDEYMWPGYKLTRTEFQRQFSNVQQPCGIYEGKARYTVTGIEYVVYTGSTCRSKSGNFIDRIYEYCIDGHTKNFID